MSVTPGVLDNRATAHYRGQHLDIVGQVMGPNGWGEMVVIDEATYDAAADMTTARFSVATTRDIPPAATKEAHA